MAIDKKIWIFGAAGAVVIGGFIWYDKHNKKTANTTANAAPTGANQSAYAYGYGYGYGQFPSEYGYGNYGYGGYGGGGGFGGGYNPYSYYGYQPYGGNGLTVVPDVTGLPAGAAHNNIVGAGLIPFAVSSQQPKDITTGTVPAGGTEVPKNTRVRILSAPHKKKGR